MNTENMKRLIVVSVASDLSDEVWDHAQLSICSKPRSIRNDVWDGVGVPVWNTIRQSLEFKLENRIKIN